MASAVRVWGPSRTPDAARAECYVLLCEHGHTVLCRSLADIIADFRTDVVFTRQLQAALAEHGATYGCPCVPLAEAQLAAALEVPDGA